MLPPVLQAAFLLLGGLVMCFRGRALFKLLLPAMGFVVFGLAAVALARPYAANDLPILAAMAFVGGAIGAALMMAAYLYGLFLVGAAFGAHLGALIAHRIGMDPGTAMLLAGILGGMLAIAAERVLVILATSLWGAMFAITGVLMFAGRIAIIQLADPSALVALAQQAQAVPLAWLLLALVGLIVQTRTERRTVVVR